MMTVPLKSVLKTLPARRRRKIAVETANLIDRELSLRQLRKALRLTQRDVAQRLSIKQANVSKLESRSDILLSTLREYVASLGGNLALMVEFEGHKQLRLADLASIGGPEKASKKPKKSVAGA